MCNLERKSVLSASSRSPRQDDHQESQDISLRAESLKRERGYQPENGANIYSKERARTVKMAKTRRSGKIISGCGEKAAQNPDAHLAVVVLLVGFLLKLSKDML